MVSSAQTTRQTGSTPYSHHTRPCRLRFPDPSRSYYLNEPRLIFDERVVPSRKEQMRRGPRFSFLFCWHDSLLPAGPCCCTRCGSRAPNWTCVDLCSLQSPNSSVSSPIFSLLGPVPAYCLFKKAPNCFLHKLSPVILKPRSAICALQAKARRLCCISTSIMCHDPAPITHPIPIPLPTAQSPDTLHLGAGRYEIRTFIARRVLHPTCLRIYSWLWS